jgi:hypothetical protein
LTDGACNTHIFSQSLRAPYVNGAYIKICIKAALFFSLRVSVLLSQYRENALGNDNGESIELSRRLVFVPLRDMTYFLPPPHAAPHTICDVEQKQLPCAYAPSALDY